MYAEGLLFGGGALLEALPGTSVNKAIITYPPLIQMKLTLVQVKELGGECKLFFKTESS